MPVDVEEIWILEHNTLVDKSQKEKMSQRVLNNALRLKYEQLREASVATCLNLAFLASLGAPNDCAALTAGAPISQILASSLHPSEPFPPQLRLVDFRIHGKDRSYLPHSVHALLIFFGQGRGL